jgi:hypothetical protein
VVRPARTLTLVLTFACALVPAGCSRRDPTIVVHGVVTVHPENDCRFATSGHVRPVLVNTEVDFTDVVSHRSYSTRTRPASVRIDPEVCRQTARYSITVPEAATYRVQVQHYSAFGSRPPPVTVSLEDLRAHGYRLNLNADPATGE